MKHLICIDYSGTLSLTMPEFASKWLNYYLEECGLTMYPIPVGEDFFREMIIPVWEEASIKDVPYARCLTRQIMKETKIPKELEEEILYKTHCLIHAYFIKGTIDSQWKKLLQFLLSKKDTFIIVVSDHYFDARHYFPFHLRELGFQSQVLENNISIRKKGTIYLAISAIMGNRKDHPHFWKNLKEKLSMEHDEIRNVVLIDDFGSQENDFGFYNSSEKITSRQKNIKQAIQKAFYIEPNLYHFKVKTPVTTFELSQVLDELQEWLEMIPDLS
jgi:hypothetical protein